MNTGPKEKILNDDNSRPVTAEQRLRTWHQASSGARAGQSANLSSCTDVSGFLTILVEEIS
jgi:hypothetical protein